MKNNIIIIRSLLISFKDERMNYYQNMAMFNLIMLNMGEKAADVFTNSMRSSDEKHNYETTYIFSDSISNIWNDMVREFQYEITDPERNS